MTNLVLRINHSSTDSSYVSAPSNYIDVALDDAFIFTAGSAVVADGQSIPTQTDLNRAATVLDPLLETIVAHYLLADTSANLLKEIYLAGQKNKRYVFCCSFDGATASEPILEAWDTNALSTIGLTCLGTGIANNSWFHAVCTTSNPPGLLWTGASLAGSASVNTVLLNDNLGPLTVAKDLYFNFYVKIPAAVLVPELYLPVLLITYDTN